MLSNYLVIAMLFAIVHLASHLLMPLNIRFSKRFNIVAHPNERRINKTAIPEAGGLCFAIPIILAQAVYGLLTGYSEVSNMLLQLSGAGLVAIGLGMWDDKYESKAYHKLLGQIFLGVLMYVIGYRVLFLTNPLGEHFVLGWMSLPVTILWYVVILNAINLIDGLDGLASGISIIVSLVLLVVGIKEANNLVVIICSLLIAGNSAFLIYNFFPAKIFLGDTGAMFIGLNIAAISTAGSSQFKGITSMTLMIPLTVMAVPLLDVGLAVLRRIRYGKLFTADKGHIHHTMLAFGFSQKAISIIVYIVTLLFGLIAIGFSFSSKKLVFSLLLGLLAMMVVIAYWLMRQEQKK